MMGWLSPRRGDPTQQDPDCQGVKMEGVEGAGAGRTWSVMKQEEEEGLVVKMESPLRCAHEQDPLEDG